MKKKLNKIYGYLNRVKYLLAFIKTQIWYKFFFKNIGVKTKIIKPMFIANPYGIDIGKNVFIRDYARIEVIGSGHLSIGNNVSIEQSVNIVCINKLIIGSNTTISFRVMITDVDHSYDEIGVNILQQENKIKETIIGENCFIGAGVCILAGTKLGDQSIVGANSVVHGEFPKYSVIVGSPAKIVKRYDTNAKVWKKTDSIGNFL